jgi:TRAP-type C4-dicarboxylate transport system substrate-binding protein
MQIRRTLLGLALGAAGLLAGTAHAAEFTLKYGHVGPATEISDDQIPGVFLKSFLESRSQGRIAVEIYPASQLGGFRELIEQVQLNALELTHTSVGGSSAFLPEIQVTDIPYMIRDDLVAEQVAKGPFFAKLRDAFLAKTGNVRLVGMGNTGRWRSFFLKDRFVKTPADLSGVKIRVVDSLLQIDFMKSLGANPTPIPWGEVYTSLATGVVSGLNIAVTDIVPNNMQEVVKYATLDEHMYLLAFWWMSDSWLKGLPADLQALVMDGINQAAMIQTEWNKQYESRAFEQFVKAGGQIYVPTPAEKETFLIGRERAQDWFVKTYGNEWLDAWKSALRQAEEEVDAERAELSGKL